MTDTIFVTGGCVGLKKERICIMEKNNYSENKMKNSGQDCRNSTNSQNAQNSYKNSNSQNAQNSKNSTSKNAKDSTSNKTSGKNSYEDRY